MNCAGGALLWRGEVGGESKEGPIGDEGGWSGVCGCQGSGFE